MTTQTILDDRQSAGFGLGIHLAMTAISLAVVGAFIWWHAWPDGGHRAESTTEAVAVSAGAEETMPRGGLAELYGEQEAAARASTEWLYIVESEAHAQSLIDPREFLTDADTSIWQPTSSNVIWFDSEESETRFWQMQGEGEVVRDFFRMPHLTMVDLRGSARTVTPQAGSGPTDACGHSVHKGDC
jgi:hypothetical protein